MALGAAVKKKVLFVINSLTGGGAERVMTTILAHSKGRSGEFEIGLAVLDDESRAFEVPEWLTVHQLDCQRDTIESVRQLGALAREIAPDVTLSFLTRSNIASVIASKRGKHPCIISERTSTSAHLGSGFRPMVTKALIRIFYPRATRVIAPSSDIAKKLARNFAVAEERVDVIPNPVDTEALVRASSDPSAFEVEGPYVMAVGRLVAVKNYALLIRAFAQSGFPGRLVIAGDGPELENLRQLAKDVGIADRLILPGFLKNPYRALKGAKLFALSSDVEGFPNALVEALALNVPAVATNCRDGPAEILAASSADQIEELSVAPAGILTPVGDVGSFARALDLAMDEAVRSRISAEGARRVADYSAASVVDRYWQVIERALAQPGQTRAGHKLPFA